MRPVWVVDDDPSIRYVLDEYLHSIDLPVTCFAEADGVLDALTETRPGLLMADVRLKDGDGIELMQQVRSRLPELPVIVMTAYSDLDSAVSAFQGGAFEFLAKPFDLDEVGRLARKALSAPTTPVRENVPGGHLIGQSPAFREIIRTIGRLSRSDITVLVTGETGTGKEVVARALHAHSRRRNHPFVAINTAAIPEDLLESELFGHEKGAFTGAVARHPGRFEQAHGGTLFLDEIGDMPAALQSRLLRVLAEGEYYRVGGRDLLTADVRIIAASHRDLARRVEQETFRADLYHRLKVITLSLPALRDRREDLPELVRHFLRESTDEFGLPVKSPDSALLNHLTGLPWPGNVRELKHLCQSLAVLAPAGTIGIDDLPPEYRDADNREPADWLPSLRAWLQARLNGGEDDLFERARGMLESELAQQAVQACGGNRSAAARRLGISRNTLANYLGKEASGEGEG